MLQSQCLSPSEPGVPRGTGILSGMKQNLLINIWTKTSYTSEGKLCRPGLIFLFFIVRHDGVGINSELLGIPGVTNLENGKL